MIALPNEPTPTKTSPLLDAALLYASWGWRVFPLHTVIGGKYCSCNNRECPDKTKGKHPRIKFWQRDGTTDPSAVIKWWTAWPDANIGIVTGAESGLVVIDLDADKGGYESWIELIREHTPLLETVRSVTGSGGSHILYAHPGGGVVLRNSAGTATTGLAHGVDVRGDGGYIVAPPSLNLAGAYSWDLQYEPPEQELAPLPNWLRALIESERSGGSTVGPSQGAPGSQEIEEGGRNAHLTSLGGTLRRRGMDEEEIAATLLMVNERRCRPPLPEQEVRGIAISVSRYEPEVEGPRLVFSQNGHGEAGDISRKTGVEQPVTPTRWTPRPLSALQSQMEEEDWQWYGFLAPGNITLFTGLWKSGKTTLLSYLMKALDGQADTFAGFAVKSARVLIVSEEHERHWATRRDTLGIGDHVHIINRPFMRRADHGSWLQFLEYLVEQVRAGGYEIVVIDSLHNMWPVGDENSASEVTRALTPLTSIAELGASVLLLGHPAKADAGEGRATRGSGASGGLVDIILEMRRYDPEHRDDTRRVLTSFSRFEATPTEVVWLWEKDQGYKLLGTKGETRAKDRYEVLAAILPEAAPGLTVEDVVERWPENDVKPSERTVSRELYQAYSKGLLDRLGAGVKNKPYMYWRRQSPTLIYSGQEVLPHDGK